MNNLRARWGLVFQHMREDRQARRWNMSLYKALHYYAQQGNMRRAMRCAYRLGEKELYSLALQAYLLEKLADSLTLKESDNG